MNKLFKIFLPTLIIVPMFNISCNNGRGLPKSITFLDENVTYTTTQNEMSVIYDVTLNEEKKILNLGKENILVKLDGAEFTIDNFAYQRNKNDFSKCTIGFSTEYTKNKNIEIKLGITDEDVTFNEFQCSFTTCDCPFEIVTKEITMNVYDSTKQTIQIKKTKNYAPTIADEIYVAALVVTMTLN